VPLYFKVEAQQNQTPDSQLVEVLAPDNREQVHPACRNGRPVSHCQRNNEYNSPETDPTVPDTAMLDLRQQTAPI